MDPSRKAPFPVYSHPRRESLCYNLCIQINDGLSQIDSIVPNYRCPTASLIRNAYQSVPAWTNHLETNQGLQDRLDATLGTAGVSSWSSWCTQAFLFFSYTKYLKHITDDHFSNAFTSRTCHGHPLPCNTTGSCISDADADRVFALGDFEYKCVRSKSLRPPFIHVPARSSYILNAAENATPYVRLTFGVFFAELAQNFKLLESGDESFLLRFYIGDDGSMIRLAAGLGLGKTKALRWPALGSEIVTEVSIRRSCLSCFDLLFTVGVEREGRNPFYPCTS
jgi:hypothetical protein